MRSRSLENAEEDLLSSPVLWALYTAQLNQRSPHLKLLACKDPGACDMWEDFIKKASTSSCFVSSAPCHSTQPLSSRCVLQLLHDDQVVAIVHMKILANRFGSVDSCTLPDYQGRGYNKLLRLLAYHAMVTHLHCEVLFTYAASKATEHVVTKTFLWTRLDEESPLAEEIASVEGDLAEFVGDYRTVNTDASLRLQELYHAKFFPGH